MSADTAVHTSAQEPDLFPAEDPQPGRQRLQFQGRLATRPHVANRPCGRDGRFLPVLVLELDDVGLGHHRVTAFVPYTDATREAAERTAKQLHVDQVVTVSTDSVDLRLTLPAAALVIDPESDNHS
jgi:hypothetical protein